MTTPTSSNAKWAVMASVKFKIAVRLAVLMVAAFAVFTWGLARQQREAMLETAAAHILQLSDAIVRSTTFMMKENKPDYVHQIIEDVAREKNIDRIRIFSKTGKVIDSSYGGEIGLVVDPKAEGCVSCHTGEAPPPVRLRDRDRVRYFQDLNGRRLIGTMQVLHNEPTCRDAGCHAHRNAPPVLGVVDIVYSIEGVEQRVDQAVLRTALTALGFVLLAAVGVFVVVQRLVYRPLRDLDAGSKRLAGGNLEDPLPVRSPDEFGQVAASFNSMMDALRASRRELSDAARLLEQKVEERTRQLRAAEAQAVQQQKLAATGLLASGIAHEINNPLTGVLTFSTMIRQKMPEGSQDAEDMDLVISETKRCAEIIRRLLDFARQKAPERRYRDLNALIAETTRFVEQSAKRKGTAIELDLDPALPQVWIDDNQVKQVVVNMLVNAQHATEQGGSIRVATQRVPEPMAPEPDAVPVDMVQITIADTGCGIPEQDLPKIFDPFFTSKEVGKGTGLGLSVSHGVVKGHGGAIRVESVVGQGTTLRVYLPVAERSAAAAATSTGAAPTVA